jgi:NADH:ubiquinone oxidoreductase subunit D
MLNFGPQHPASHGVLRLVLSLQGEMILRADSNIGFLHRGTEKLIEQRFYLKSIPYFDRLDYVSMMSQEHSFCLGIENLLNTVSSVALYSQIRTLFDELTRLMNHFLGISTHSLDVGNMSPAFWAFEEREKLMEFYERVSGARMHAAFYRPNLVDWTGLNYQFFIDVLFFLNNSFKSIMEMFTILATNNIWKSRLVRIGVVDFSTALLYGATGVIARSGGFKKDLRLLKSTSYSFYWYLKFKSFLGKTGDCFDRFIIRIREMLESIYIIYQIIPNIVNFLSVESKFNLSSVSVDKLAYLNFFNSIAPNLSEYSNYQGKSLSMESVISHFKYYSEGLKVPAGSIYASIESPKGEFGVSIISDGSVKPYRCKIRTPAYNHLQLMSYLNEGHYFADMVTILGSQDIVFGEVDR